MQVSHVISDLALGLVGLYVFFRYIIRLPLMETVLWESFVLSVTVAAFFGAARFAGLEQAGYVAGFFQNLASTVGALGLAVVAWFKVWKDNTLDNKIGVTVLTIGFLLFVINQVMGLHQIIRFIPVVCMLLVAGAAVKGLLNGQISLALWLFAGVAFAALATFRDSFVADDHNAIDVYHYLLAASVLCFGMAASKPSL